MEFPIWYPVWNKEGMKYYVEILWNETFIGLFASDNEFLVKPYRYFCKKRKYCSEYIYQTHDNFSICPNIKFGFFFTYLLWK